MHAPCSHRCPSCQCSTVRPRRHTPACPSTAHTLNYQCSTACCTRQTQNWINVQARSQIRKEMAAHQSGRLWTTSDTYSALQSTTKASTMLKSCSPGGTWPLSSRPCPASRRRRLCHPSCLTHRRRPVLPRYTAHALHQRQCLDSC